MIVLIQRVSSSSVVINKEKVASIGRGLLLLVGVENNDTDEDIKYCARKCAELRIFPDDENKMNCSVLEAGGEAIVVSQFTLPAKIGKGRRPSFSYAMAGEEAERLYNLFVSELKTQGVPTQTGVFAAMMDVHLVNDGPVTFILNSRKKDR